MTQKTVNHDHPTEVNGMMVMNIKVNTDGAVEGDWVPMVLTVRQARTDLSREVVEQLYAAVLEFSSKESVKARAISHLHTRALVTASLTADDFRANIPGLRWDLLDQDDLDDIQRRIAESITGIELPVSRARVLEL